MTSTEKKNILKETPQGRAILKKAEQRHKDVHELLKQIEAARKGYRGQVRELFQLFREVNRLENQADDAGIAIRVKMIERAYKEAEAAATATMIELTSKDVRFRAPRPRKKMARAKARKKA